MLDASNMLVLNQQHNYMDIILIITKYTVFPVNFKNEILRHSLTRPTLGDISYHFRQKKYVLCNFLLTEKDYMGFEDKSFHKALPTN